MRRNLTDSEVIGASLGAIAAMCIAGLLGSVRAQVSQANAGLVLVLVIIAASTIGGRWAGGATALAAAVSFDFFLTKPYGSLAIKSSDDVIATALLFIVGLSVGQLANERREAKVAGQAGTDEVAGIFRVAKLTSEGANLLQVIASVEREVADVLHLEACQFQALPLDPPLPEIQPTGRVDAPYVHVGDGFVLPADGVTIAVRSQGRIQGWLVCRPAPGLVGVSQDRRRTALVLADHLGLTLTQADATAA